MPATSVIALCAPGVPSNGIPKSRALGLVCAKAAVKDKKINSSELIINAGTEFPRRGELFFRVMSSVLFIEGAPYSLVRSDRARARFTPPRCLHSTLRDFFGCNRPAFVCTPATADQ